MRKVYFFNRMATWNIIKERTYIFMTLACIRGGVIGYLAERKTVAHEFTVGDAESEPTVVTISETLTSERLDRYLTTQLTHISRGGIQRLLREGSILVDGNTAKPSQHPVAGQKVEITWAVPKEVEVRPLALPL